MPCIKTNNNDRSYAPVSYCGKTIHFPTPFFKDTIDAYRDDKPICPKCRKILGLEKKTITKKITSISLIDTTMTIHYNDKSKIIKNVNFSDTVGFYINDLNDIDNDDIHKIKDYLKIKTKDYVKSKIKRLNMKNDQIKTLENVIHKTNKNNIFDLSNNEIQHLQEFLDILKLFSLNNK